MGEKNIVRGSPWRFAARRFEKAAFGVAAGAYLLPFIQSHFPLIGSMLGLQLFVWAFPALVMQPITGVVFFAAYGLPLIVAVIGLLRRSQDTRMSALAGLGLAAVGLAGILVGYLGLPPSTRWWAPGPGYYAAESGFVVAAIAAGVLLITSSRLQAVDEPDRDGPSLSATQELVRRYRDF